MKVVVLFRELSPYILTCFRELSAACSETVSVFCLPVNSEAPFAIKNEPGLELISRHGLSGKALLAAVEERKPDLLFVADWTNLNVLQVAIRMRRKSVTVFGFDNHWFGTGKQRMLTMAARIFFPRIFSGVFIPGEPQREMARRMGFSNEQIRTGAYSADTSTFNQYFTITQEKKRQQFPHRFLCVARYVNAKGLPVLWEAFLDARSELNTDWELWCVGTGELWDERLQHPAIRHIGFVQPEDMGPIIRDTGVFVLPSIFEPWGVVVHEYAVAGFPLLLSNAVGAASMFLSPNENGYSFSAGDKNGLKSALLNFMKMNDMELWAMAEKSRMAGRAHDPKKWAQALLSFCAKK
jgi:glycosyltransferase involved in cell wall biosynthesis